MPLAPFMIRNEDDLFHALELIKQKEWPQGQIVLFDGWPTFDISISGPQFSGGFPSRILTDILTIQRVINKVYSLRVYGSASRLPDHDLKKSELTIRVEPGSSRFLADLSAFFNTILGRVEEPEDVVVVLGMCAILATVYGWYIYIRNKTKIRKLGYALELSKEETKRLNMMANICENSDDMKKIISNLSDVISKFTRRLNNEDSIESGGRHIMNGRIARGLSSSRYSDDDENNIRSEFSILTIRTGSRRRAFTLTLRDERTGKNYSIRMGNSRENLNTVALLQETQRANDLIVLEIQVEEEKQLVSREKLLSIMQRLNRS